MNSREKISGIIELYRLPILVFLGSFFILMSFSGTRLFLSDEGVILDQFYNLIQGTLAIKIAKIDTVKGVFIFTGDNLYGRFSYSLLILSLPAYYLLKIIDSIYSAHLFMLQLWALSGGLIVYLIAGYRKSSRSGIAGIISYLILIAANLYFFEPISFPKWGELLAIEFTNILVTALMVTVAYLFFRDIFGEKIALFSSLFILLATPIPFYALTLKHHSLTILLTIMTFYFSHKYFRTKDSRFIYYAYVAAGLCVWTRIFEGVVLLISLLVSDILFFRRDVRHLLRTIVVILVSLMPFFIFNYMILGSPFTIIDDIPVTDKLVTLPTSPDFISLGENKDMEKQVELLKNLGYRWSANIRGDPLEITSYVLFFRLINTFGIFSVASFLILVFVFFSDLIFKKIKPGFIDIFFILYSLLFITLSGKYMIEIVRDTPAVLEYRYLLTLYVVFLFFVLRIQKIRDIITEKWGSMLISYFLILVFIGAYFVIGFPIPFLNIFYDINSMIYVLLLIMFSIYIYLYGKKPRKLIDNSLAFIISLSIALSTSFIVFYYWVASMTYISVSQNHTVMPLAGIVLEWMYKIIFKVM